MMKNLALISSLIINSFLLIYLFGPLHFFLFISLVANICCILYTRFLLNERSRLYQDYGVLLNEAEEFLNHLSQIYELEMFYGDETLESLINHSKRLINKFYEYENKYFEQVEQEFNQEQQVEND